MKKKSNLFLRKDIVSKKKLPKGQLIRIVKNKQNKIFIDKDQNSFGRGIYIQPNLEYVDIAKKTRAIERGLKCNNLDLDIYEQLKLFIKINNV